MDKYGQHSSIKLNSNIMLKTKYEKDPLGYLPPDLLPAYYSDTRMRNTLTTLQKLQFEKKLFYADKIIDE